MQKIFLLAMIVTVCFFYACSKKTAGNPDPPTTLDCNGIDSHFGTRVLPIIQTNCAIAGCHNNGSGNGPGALTNFSQISNASGRIRSEVSSGRMPLGGHLSALDKNTILCWVSSGSPNN